MTDGNNKMNNKKHLHPVLKIQIVRKVPYPDYRLLQEERTGIKYEDEDITIVLQIHWFSNYKTTKENILENFLE